MRLFLLVVVVAGCGHPAAQKPPPAEVPVDKISDLAGRWVTSDEMDTSYEMTITPKGDIDVWIDRGKMGRCEQKGTIVALADKMVRVIYTTGGCNPQAVRVPIDMRVTSFTGQSLTVDVQGDARTYQRASDEAHGKPAAVQLRH